MLHSGHECTLRGDIFYGCKLECERFSVVCEVLRASGQCDLK